MIIKGKGVNVWGKGCAGEHTEIGAYVEIAGVVGDYCKIQAYTFIPPGVTIGDRVFIGPHTCFTNDKHPNAGKVWTQANTIVEDDVAIGANSTILPVRIGKGAVVGAGSVVTKDVEPNTTVYGNPARKSE